jgi:hypothetical protein
MDLVSNEITEQAFPVPRMQADDEIVKVRKKIVIEPPKRTRLTYLLKVAMALFSPSWGVTSSIPGRFLKRSLFALRAGLPLPWSENGEY